jgi:hypothetical protein
VPRDPAHVAAETAFRKLLRDAGMVEPDEVEDHPGEILCLWLEQKVAVVIELEPS